MRHWHLASVPKVVHFRVDFAPRQRLIVDRWRSVDRRPHNNVLSRRVRGEAREGCDVVRWVMERYLGSDVWGQTDWTMEEQTSSPPSEAATLDRLIGHVVPKPLEVGRI